MKLIARSVSALVFAGTMLVSTAAFASSAQIAHQAYRGELAGIPGFQRLEQGLNSRKITVDDIIQAAGMEPTPALRSSVRSSLRVIADFN